MHNAIQFLETMGGNAAMARLSYTGYRDLVASIEMDQDQRDALLDKDMGRLRDILGGRKAMLCIVVAPVDPDEESSEERHRGDEDSGSGSESRREQVSF